MSYKPTTVKDLISELQQCDPDAIVLYAHDEYGRTGVHGFISDDDMVALDSEDQFVMVDNELVSFCQEDVDDLIPEYQEIVDKYNNVHPAIMLFAE